MFYYDVSIEGLRGVREGEDVGAITFHIFLVISATSVESER